MNLQLELELTPDPRLRLILASIWAILFVAAAVALRRRWPPVRVIIPILLLIYGLYRVGLLVAFAQTEDSRGGWPVLAVSFAIATLLAAWVLNRKSIRSYFGLLVQPPGGSR